MPHKVYVIQNPHRFDRNKQELVPKFDFTSAEKYGEVEFLLSPQAAPFNSGGIIDELEEKLENITHEDYLLLVGNPCLIGFAAAIAARNLKTTF